MYFRYVFQLLVFQLLYNTGVITAMNPSDGAYNYGVERRSVLESCKQERF